MSGSSAFNQNSIYGLKGVAASANVPGARAEAVTWVGKDGHLWLFGGNGNSPGGGVSSIHFNDLWEFDPATNLWTWVSGSDAGGGGAYGMLGIAASGNVPGSRAGAVGFTDTAGNLWLFGGWGFDSIGQFGTMNDFWKFDVLSLQWTWMGGANTLPDNNDSCQPGVFGTLGVEAAANVPSGRYLAAGWADTAGNFWLFGGGSCDANGYQAITDDLWKYSPSTAQWTWVSGNPFYQPGVYGTIGTASAANVPGSRWSPATFTDHAGNLWLFGGSAADASGVRGYLNDLWEWNTSTSQWTWISGSSSAGTANCYQAGIECAPSGVYGSLGQPAPGNVPGGRSDAVGSVDGSGNLWLFGGENNANGQSNLLNDLWKFDVQSSQWAWMSGSSTITCAAKTSQGQCAIDGSAGAYGTLRVPAAGNAPGSRSSHASWSDADGNFWLFGGDGLDGSGNLGILNDLWVYRAPQFSPDFALTALPSALNVQPGSNATVTLTVTPQSGFNSAVTFACGGLPAGVTCAFSPTSVTPTGGNAAATQVTFTASASASSQRPDQHQNPGPFVPVLALASIFAWRFRRRSILPLLLLAGLGLAFLSACGGGGSGTPPINATVTVTATSGSIQQAATINLTVN